MVSTLQLRNQRAELTRLTDFVIAFSAQHALAEAERARLLTILDELFTNIVSYGYEGSGSDGRIDVSLSLRANRLTIEVVDDGRPFDPSSAATADIALPTADRPIGGLGLLIVRSLVDEFKYSAEGGHNRLVLQRSVPTASQCADSTGH